MQVWRQRPTCKILFRVSLVLNFLLQTNTLMDIASYTIIIWLQKSTWQQHWQYARKFVVCVILIGGYCSILSPYNYEPFEVGDGLSLFDIGQLANNALIARKLSAWCYKRVCSIFTHLLELFIVVLFQLYLTTDGYGIFTITSFFGMQQGPFMLNPIFESSSPSDFWGRRWNLVVHGLLKRYVFLFMSIVHCQSKFQIQ